MTTYIVAFWRRRGQCLTAQVQGLLSIATAVAQDLGLVSAVSPFYLFQPNNLPPLLFRFGKKE